MHSFEYAVGGLENPTDIIVVPVGFETDFMSVPWGFRNFVAVFGKRSKAAVIHDYMLVSGYSISYTNKVFREALRVLGAGPIEAGVLFAAVHLYTHTKKMLGGKFD